MSQTDEDVPSPFDAADFPPEERRAAKYLWALDGVSTAYVILPVVLFQWGWLRAYYAYPLMLLVFVSAWLTWRASRPEAFALQTSLKVHKRRIFLLGLLCLFLTVCSGIGGFTFQFYDYHFNESLLRDLMQYRLPIAFAEAGPEHKPLLFTMYLAYWLPAGIAGKVVGWYAANYLHFLWAAGGLLLLALWFLRIVGTTRLAFALLFLFFGGMDIVGRLLSEGGPAAANVGWWDYITGVFWWGEGRGWLDHWSSGFATTDPEIARKMGGVFYRFYSPLSFLVDGPQHLVPGMIAVMMIIHDLWRRHTTERCLFLWSCVFFGSPFVTAGAVPFMVVGFMENRARNLLSFANMVAIPVVAVFITYFTGALGGTRISGWVWEYVNLQDTWWLLLLHYVVEFALLAALIPTIRQPGYMPGVLWFLGALTMFVLAPFYRMGQFNDFASKVILPAQFVFILYIAMAIRRSTTPAQRARAAALIVLLAIGAIGPLGMLVRAFDFGLLHTPTAINNVRHLNDMEPRGSIMQGKGDPDSFFWSVLAKPAVYRPSELIYPNLVWNFLELKEPLSYWIFFEGEQYQLSRRGLEIKTKGNKPILRRDDMGLDTDAVGKIEVDVDITVDGRPAKDAAIVAVWATPEQVEKAEGKWPFQRWHSNQAWPVRALVKYNSYWRGIAQDMAFYLRVPPGDDRTYEVVIRKISFLER